jgi:hypothetical protein
MSVKKGAAGDQPPEPLEELGEGRDGGAPEDLGLAVLEACESLG